MERNIHSLRARVMYHEAQVDTSRKMGHPVAALVDSTAALFWKARVMGAKMASRTRRRGSSSR